MRTHKKEIGLWKQFQKAKHTLKHFQPISSSWEELGVAVQGVKTDWHAPQGAHPQRTPSFCGGFAITISSLQHPQKTLCRVPPQHCKGWTSLGWCLSAHWMVGLHSKEAALPFPAALTGCTSALPARCLLPYEANCTFESVYFFLSAIKWP